MVNRWIKFSMKDFYEGRLIYGLLYNTLKRNWNDILPVKDLKTPFIYRSPSNAFNSLLRPSLYERFCKYIFFQTNGLENVGDERSSTRLASFPFKIDLIFPCVVKMLTRKVDWMFYNRLYIAVVGPFFTTNHQWVCQSVDL